METLKKFISDELHSDPDFYLSNFEKYQDLILDWNKKINLISRKSESIEDHILNSIFFLTKFKINNGQKIADIGTGGGFPGIPLKILYPEIELTLIDSIQKKVTVLEDVIMKMNFKDTKAVWARAEELSMNKIYRNKYDIVISKAVATLDKLYLWGKNFLKKDGKMICIKGGEINSEIETLNKLNEKINIEEILFSFGQGYNIEDKKIVVIQKKQTVK
ncbi:MAG TPA: 16S rRNA (guanine(527)-N(7))-methyltransferase RsmG [Ignavibacteria bacterium]|nr:16S rRNA (guanine(527)-N(7))-methyltransferase RsmG [Ignavibacteria bacterium]HRB00090.1 16S rRNA (guanine(527)-N(7))-methyltransferase RsmG [Ignavibacteria bacterium]